MSDLTLFFTVAFFAFGTIIGSMLSVITYRMHSKEGGMIAGRSFCPHCKVKLKPYDMIPLFSYAFLGGRCRSCGKKISINYFLIELITGLVFALTFFNFNFITNSEITGLTTAFWMLIFTFAIAIFFYDLNYKEIPLKLTVPMIVLGALGSYFILGTELTDILIGAVLGKLFFWVQYYISKGKWIGLGDSDLGLAIGAILGGKYLLVALLVSYIIASVVCIFLLATKKATRKTKIPFGPFLTTGLYITVLYGVQIADWYFNLTFF